jgi:hypothetical protein
MPKVQDEVEQLKSYVNTELNSRASEILDVAVDRKQLKRSMQRLLKSLQEEVSNATQPVHCDACALRTGVHSGTNCLSCAQQMKLQSRLASYAGLTNAGEVASEHEVLASRGGGFMVTSSSLRSQSVTHETLALGRRPASRQLAQGQIASTFAANQTAEWRAGAGAAIRPGSHASRQSLSRTAVLGAGDTVKDHFPLPSVVPSVPPTPAVSAQPQVSSMRSELGSDGRVYTSRGGRTHKLVAANAAGGKSRARAAEEGDGLAQWREEKERENIAAGSQSARLPRK